MFGTFSRRRTRGAVAGLTTELLLMLIRRRSEFSKLTPTKSLRRLLRLGSVRATMVLRYSACE